MYGCNHSIGCLSVSAWRADSPLSVKASRADFSEEKDGLEVSAWIIGDGLRVSAGIVCSVSRDSYLRVVPDVVWLSPDELASAEFDIYSNVVWKID